MSQLPRLSLEKSMEAETLAEKVYESLLKAILTGKLEPGAAVSVVKLSSQLGVSRTPVHEAIRQLVNDGLVTQEANHRPVIASFSGDDVDDIYEMRRLLEGEAAFRAATRIDRPTLHAIRRALSDLASRKRNAAWLREWASHDSELHDSIALASGSPRLWADIRRYRRLHHGFNALCSDPKDLGQALEEHIKIIEALDARDPNAAREAMDAHLREWKTYFSQRISQTAR